MIALLEHIDWFGRVTNWFHLPIWQWLFITLPVFFRYWTSWLQLNRDDYVAHVPRTFYPYDHRWALTTHSYDLQWASYSLISSFSQVFIALIQTCLSFSIDCHLFHVSVNINKLWDFYYNIFPSKFKWIPLICPC
jgi:hypothetical protein